ncbi:ABC transporter [Pseudohongiella acticola]|uniref:ABC transporter n=1 Tax=Pseudohongiella acticola TaxID=1524254 RepID=A0A1E8CLF4_9GAMM|nr:ABC transporter ATP-binding protein [Pseudohongiella acticola]OFE13132.1 ABC transporter [Pseudohongiella acticola]
MTHTAIALQGVCKRYPFFQLNDLSFSLEEGQIMGFVGPNGAGKSTTIRLIMGLLQPDAGQVSVLGQRMTDQQAQAKRDIAFVADGMGLHANATLGWHIDFVRTMVPYWDKHYADQLLKRFNLHLPQTIKSLSTGERVKALLLLALARRPRLLVLDEPTTGLDPVARHEILAELTDVLLDDSRSVLFSSHNTRDVEQISDQITFIDRGRLIESSDRDSFIERWRRIHLNVPDHVVLPADQGRADVVTSGHTTTITTGNWSPSLEQAYINSGAVIHEVQRMNLEEIFIASVLSKRRQIEAEESAA